MGRVIGQVTYQADDFNDYSNALVGVDLGENLTLISEDSESLQIVFNIG